MNAVLQVETATEAANRLSAGAGAGFKAQALHEYRDADGQPIYWRMRLKNPASGEKWIRPMHWKGSAFVIGEPPAAAEGKTLYRLPELLAADPAAVVLIVEGEWCADHLHKLGLIVTTSGSAASVNAANWTPLRGRQCLLWPDHDGPGSKYADEVAAILRALDCTVGTIDVEALGLPEKGDAVNWLAQHPEAMAADVLALPRAVYQLEKQSPEIKESAGFAGAPEPLRRPVPKPEPYPVAELGAILGSACESLRRVIQAPDAICGASLLAAASLAVQGLADVEIDGRVYPLSLWFLSVAESGERKTGIDSEVMRGGRDYEKELAAAYSQACSTHEAEMEEWTARRDAAKTSAKKNHGDGLAEKLRDIGPAPLPPLLPKLTVADFTAEGVAKLLTTGRPSIGAFTDEAALVFGGHGMTKETVSRTAGTLCKLWDSGTLDRVRAADGAVKLWGRRMALHLLAQPIIAERALSDDVLSGQGFLARCLLAWPQGTAGTRSYRTESLLEDAALIRFSGRMADVLRQPLPLAIDTRNELDPPRLRLSPGGFDVWRGVHDTIEVAMKPSGRYASVKPWASKAPEQVLRIAGVLTLFEQGNVTVIDAATVERAAELALWHLNEAVRLAGTAELSPEIRDAEALLQWCWEKGARRCTPGKYCSTDRSESATGKDSGRRPPS